MIPERRVVFCYLTAVYFLAGASETYISPLFPLMHDELGLQVSDQAVLIAFLTVSIAVGNLLGGWIGDRFTDRLAVRLAAVSLTAGSLVSGFASSFATIAIGQVMAGLGTGLFFAPGLALVGRMYPATLGRAIATYGFGYSGGLAVAAFASGLGSELWRWAFFASAAFAFGFAVFTPKMPEAERVGEHSLGVLRQALGYFRSAPYRAAMTVGVVAGICNYIVIGLAPEHFVSLGVAATVIGGLVGVGRVASMVAKWISGWLLDRIGGDATAQLLMAVLVVSGLFELATPSEVGLWAVIPVVCASAMLFPVSNAMVVKALPGRSTWGVGVYRASLMVSSAIVSALSGLALHHFTTKTVMIAALTLPLLAVVAQGATWRRSPVAALPPTPAHPSEA
jgi:predicted MFS family arabinose efflux permease